MYICTFPRMQTLKILGAAFAAFAMITLALPSAAQTASEQHRRRNTSTAQAQLQINVIVVPVVIPPRHHRDRDRDRDGESVSYHLAAREDKLSVTEEVRPMLVDVQGKGLQHEPVQLTTVVAR